MKALWFFILLGTASALKAQSEDSSLVKLIRPLRFWGFGDFYFAHSFSEPRSNHIDAPGFFSSHNWSNTPAVNNAIIGMELSKEKIRGELALQAGTYVDANYHTSPQFLKFIYQAYAGVRVLKKVWLDAGIFNSHIGAESAISFDNPTLSRSMAAEYSPYYLTGARVSWQPNEKWLVRALAINGWQLITDNNQAKSLGTQVQFKPNKKWLFNSSTYYGKEPIDFGFDSGDRPRFFHDFYLIAKLTERLQIIALYDLGFQQIQRDYWMTWQTASLIARQQFAKKFAIAVRGEVFQNLAWNVFTEEKYFEYLVAGGSLNLDFTPVKQALFRVEVRNFIYPHRNNYLEENFRQRNPSTLTISLSVKLSQ